MTEKRADTEAITAQGLIDLKAELGELEGEGRNKIAERIKVAREMGDLKENTEYHIAKEDQAHLETRIKRLRERAKYAEVVEADETAQVFAFGRTAQVFDKANDKTHTWKLVGSTEANLDEGRLSAESPVGKALRDADVGKAITVTTPKGPKVFTVKKLVD